MLQHAAAQWHIQAHDCLNMSNETLCHLAIMYVNKMDKKRECEEEEYQGSHLTTVRTTVMDLKKCCTFV